MLKNKVYCELCVEIERQLNFKKQIIVAIDGQAGAGKSTLSNILKEKFNATVFHVDDYFLQPHQRTVERLNMIGGNVDFERFQLQVLIPLLNGNSVISQKYDCALQKLLKPKEVFINQLIIIEGSYSLRPELINSYDITVALSLHEDMQIKRLMKRNGVDRIDDFINKWIPLENKYFDHFDIFNKVDFLINTNNIS